MSVNREPIPEETAAEKAKLELEERISKELAAGSVLQGSEITYEAVDKDTIHVKLNMSFIENIGVETPTEEETY